jgi:hypothetical protein
VPDAPSLAAALLVGLAGLAALYAFGVLILCASFGRFACRT